ncbi:sulfite exporter TauE/SafE family protein (plasmid) [Cereibacter azotoformans]|uniref:sulfite exporter TauE/SafE family protein n=1 Tax=Cereibacter azotoformans TaxID=43057 RepID=UPI001EEA73D3|nr:sulfite exporter TauE/SafE family protein [Cereibacter azotoformans]ULB12611.1 sulfite exporter TauE/SafE family protein [Cereibacter azotoformans]
MTVYLVLILAGLAAGALNAVAGGGTFLSFPALVWTGVPPIMANATATLAALPGYLGSAWAFRADIRQGRGLPVRLVLLVSAAGGILGAALLLVTPNAVFSGIVPWLLAFATAAFAFGPAITRQVARTGRGAPGLPQSAAVLLAVTTYGGYFNGGVGILLLAAFGLIGLTDLKEMNGLKNLVSSVLSAVSVAVYVAAGLIVWKQALVLGAASAVGGYIGAALSRRIHNVKAIRVFITLVGATMSLAFFLQ